MLDFIEAIGREAGAILLRFYRDPQSVGARDKSPRNIVTAADLAAETFLRERISGEFPNHAIVGEEMSDRAGTGMRWHIDPLDGTTNFAFGIPHWCVSIGVCDDAGGLAGVVYDPLRDEMFSAERGHGATLNGTPIAAGGRTDFSDSLFATGFASMRGDVPDDRCLAIFARTIVRVRGVRRLGSAALDLAYVASGRFDLFYEDGLSSWDMAAGAVLVHEAGGVVAAYESDPDALSIRDVLQRYFETGTLVAGNPALVRTFLREIVAKGGN